jgi:hypothetical protein
MSGNRFKMDFNNNNNTPFVYRQIANAVSVPQQVQIQKAVNLSSPMINRVYTAKPGCSACGKKVM